MKALAKEQKSEVENYEFQLEVSEHLNYVVINLNENMLLFVY